MIATILQQAVGRPKKYDADGEKPWTSAIIKVKTGERLELSETQLKGDQQADLRHHGGPEKAVMAYAATHYEAWKESHDFPWGGFGENWTLSGLDELSVCLGDIYDVGSAQVQVSQPRQPCWKLSRRWGLPDLALKAQGNGRLGWYFRVLKTGAVQVGDELRRVERPLPDWSISRLNTLMHHDRQNRADAAFLAACPLLAESWRQTFRKRADGQPPADPAPRLGGS